MTAARTPAQMPDGPADTAGVPLPANASRTSSRAVMEAVTQLVQVLRAVADSDYLHLNRVQYAILALINAREGTTLTALADQLHCDLSVLSRQTATLIHQGLVVRSKDPHDARAWQVGLTELGRQRFQRAEAIRIDLIDRALAAYPDRDRTTAAAVLNSLNAAFAEVIGRRGTDPA